MSAAQNRFRKISAQNEHEFVSSKHLFQIHISTYFASDSHREAHVLPGGNLNVLWGNAQISNTYSYFLVIISLKNIVLTTGAMGVRFSIWAFDLIKIVPQNIYIYI